MYISATSLGIPMHTCNDRISIFIHKSKPGAVNIVYSVEYTLIFCT